MERIWNYIPTPAGIGAVLVTHKNIPSQKDFYYLYNDHLGSLIAATKRGSTVLQEFSYDPCSVNVAFGELAKPKAYMN